MCSDKAVHTLAPTTDIASGTLPPDIPHQAFDGAEVSDALSGDACDPQVSEEETLESHEVIELQAFSERKAWIEEKIKFLEGLPPIEVFVGIDALRSSAEVIPGLPTRQQVNEWLAEHDRIEKETEIFDSGELKKLRKFTKAATQRHLSPEDTDLIELTLTTILELDKLLHLLRDRSEHLDLLGIRLTWEEQRAAAWSDLRKISADIETFLVTRARWSPSIYEVMAKHEEKPSARRGSVASMASDTSATFGAGFSRSARFKLAEILSRDAAQIAGRISSLRHGRIASAGKALDKLIENSRKPVPEELLDEQDKLEEKGINDMEDVGKFVLSVVTQWRKADELYVETLKDRSAAQNLMEEIETARLYHPTPRQSGSFMSRADTLVKRLALRGNPFSDSSLFPRPTHSLFPEQESFNENLAQSLSSDLFSTGELVSKVESLAREYRRGYEAIKEIDTLSQRIEESLSLCRSIIHRLSNGVTTSDGDGSPPDLSTDHCLEPTAHAAFLTLLPAALLEADQANTTITTLTIKFQLALHNLDRPGVDPTFKRNATILLNTLLTVQDDLLRIVSETNARVGRLRLVKQMWSMIGDFKRSLQNVQRDIVDIMVRERWTQRMDITEPLTPKSLEVDLPSVYPTSSDISSQIETMRHALCQDVEAPLSSLSGSLEQPLFDFLTRTSTDLIERLDNLKEMMPFVEAIQLQSSTMTSIQEDVHDLQVKIEDLRIRHDVAIEEILVGDVSNDTLREEQLHLQAEADLLREGVRAFTDGIVQRVHLVSRNPSSQAFSRIFVRKKFSLADVRISSELPPMVDCPFTPGSLDDTVRADCNSFTIRLAGELESLDRKACDLKLACMAKDVDGGIASASEDIRGVYQELEDLRSTLTSISHSEERLEQLQTLSQDVEHHTSTHRSRLFRSLSLIRDCLRQMEMVSSPRTTREHLLTSRRRAVDDLELKVNAWGERAAALLGEISESLLKETRRLEAIRVQREKEAEERKQQEREEKERLAEEMRILEEHRLEEERRMPERLVQEQLARESAKENTDGRLADEEAKMETEGRAAHRGTEKEDAERLASEKTDVVVMEGIAQSGGGPSNQFEELNLSESLDVESEKVQHDTTDHRLESKVTEQTSSSLNKRVPLFSIRDEDIFGPSGAPSLSPTKADADGTDELLTRIVSLRKRLRSIGINEVARPPSANASSLRLPTLEQYGKMNARFADVLSEVAKLPALGTSPASDLELRSLRTEVETSEELILRIRQLADLADAANCADNTLSDLLEHIDSYPSPPAGPLSSPHISNSRLPPEEQLSARIGFTRRVVTQVTTYLEPVNDDTRAVAEHERVRQTWIELEEMANDRISGRKSRPSSVLSTSRNSSASGRSSQSAVSTPKSGPSNHQRKASGYSSLSLKGTPRNSFLTPSQPSSRRAVSGLSDTGRRPSSKLSMLSTGSTRSVSGPIGQQSTTTTSSLYNSTFASRQRTSSLSSNTPIPASRPSLSARPREHTRSRASPTPSELSSNSRTNYHRPSSSLSTWSRAPRQSFPSSNRIQTPPRKTQPAPKKAYVANPKNKLDVAVGDVVNKLPVNINVEVVADTWKDQSGKYWIGDQEPKLCFCRILRSQTVMVRVGGGWQELSKFIKDHFADVFRIMPPESPSRFGSPRFGSREEKWISSATLLEAPEIITSPPRTPEPRTNLIPSFILSTPSGNSPHSVKSTPSSGSPLAPLQFLRRAVPDSTSIRPVTPSKPPTHHPRSSIPNTPARRTVWRP
ncbi:hypothetical protein EV401DRAFT_1949619 [Pisolithus croceorrhizus]|nr:hypothetical protein EV401DRAFT_1949619 [Pisolithus croceorrhizus]